MQNNSQQSDIEGTNIGSKQKQDHQETQKQSRKHENRKPRKKNRMIGFYLNQNKYWTGYTGFTGYLFSMNLTSINRQN